MCSLCTDKLTRTELVACGMDRADLAPRPWTALGDKYGAGVAERHQSVRLDTAPTRLEDAYQRCMTRFERILCMRACVVHERARAAVAQISLILPIQT